MKRFKTKLPLSLMLALSVLSGCALSFDATSLGVRATVAEPTGSAPQGQQFDVTRKAVFFFWGAVGGGRPSLEEALASQLIGGTEVANLEIHVKSRFVDLLVTGLTAGLIVPRSVTFRGVVIQNAQ